ncbi:MAG: alcohol dehydrogenase catalytic domain-containing protein [Chloroflexi bacterium]|nr:alcohol dehydrogenase catalytic domain-containing protein [Chloroflexota bacterium]
MSTQHVARLFGIGDVRVLDEPLPASRDGEALIRVGAVGICGSDLHWFAEASIGDAKLASPLVLGHEFAGTVEKTGERVAVDPLIACGECEPCREGNPNLCLTQRFAGHGSEDGALREYMSWSPSCFFSLPDQLTDDDGVMLEPLGVAIHAVDLAHLKPGMTIGVYGCGPIGLLIIQVARMSGATRIFATDKLSHRMDAARNFGADVFYADDANVILTATNRRGVDVAFEVAGEDAAVDTALETVKAGGLVILAGIPEHKRTSFCASTARRKGLTVKWVRRMKHTYPRAIDLVSRGLVDVRSLVTHHFPLTQVADAFAAAARREGIKVIVKC